MAFSDAIIPELDREMAHTRKTIERVPDDKFGWKPHEKSMTMGRLAGHLAEIPGWGKMTIQMDSLDLQPPGGPPFKPQVFTSTQEVLDVFDKNVASARSAIEGASDEHLLLPWSLLFSGRVIMTMPRIAVVRGMVLSHTIHHRAQLGVYLRLNDIAVPAIYGPSADEAGMMNP